MFVYPLITSAHQYRYYIHNDDTNEISIARCNITTLQNNNPNECVSSTSYVFNIADCIGKWELYNHHDNAWHIDTNMITTQCQDIYINTIHLSPFKQINLPDGAVFTYSYFDVNLRSNVYKCKSCLNRYLYGYDITAQSSAWIIGPLGGFVADSVCNLDIKPCTFNINDCLNPGLWSNNVFIYKDINEIAEEICVELSSNSEMYRNYTINDRYKDYAIGLDINIDAYDVNDKLNIEYWCNEKSNILTSFFDSPFIFSTSVNNIIYKLPNICDNSSFISLKFTCNIESTVYIDNIYLYYDIKNVLFYDEMIEKTDWSET
eukprot:467207_1